MRREVERRRADPGVGFLMAISFKGWVSDEELVAKDAKTPNINLLRTIVRMQRNI